MPAQCCPMTSRASQLHGSPYATHSFPNVYASGNSLSHVHAKNALKVKEKENRVRMYKTIYFDPIIALLFFISGLQTWLLKVVNGLNEEIMK